ncbi:regucalcin-like [Contarinia nasturtii]|uniref:regucalcin-like n=1 Tax=Contarinia nasturtii TaxID=265458 RepID=UPI0012D48767|nr:regucalcin-like [Contarinia nasturtii]
MMFVSYFKMWKIMLCICSIATVTSQKIFQIATPNVKTGVSLHWDDCTQSVYFVDFQAIGRNRSIYRYDLNDATLYSAYIDGESLPIYIFPIKECEQYKEWFVVGLANATKIIQWNKHSAVATVASTLFTLKLNDPSMRSVVGRVDSQGRLYAGTFSYLFCGGSANASFYMYRKGEDVQRVFGNVVTTTGIAFNMPARKLYHLDSCRLQIVEFDEDKVTGDICNGRVVFDFKQHLPYFVPLGLEADSKGMLYVANYSQGSIAKIDPRTNTVIDFIDVHAKALASIVFGGPHRDILFALAGSSVLDVHTGQIAGEAIENGYLYVIRDLNARGHRYSRLII